MVNKSFVPANQQTSNCGFFGQKECLVEYAAVCVKSEVMLIYIWDSNFFWCKNVESLTVLSHMYEEAIQLFKVGNNINNYLHGPGISFIKKISPRDLYKMTLDTNFRNIAWLLPSGSGYLGCSCLASLTLGHSKLKKSTDEQPFLVTWSE